ARTAETSGPSSPVVLCNIVTASRRRTRARSNVGSWHLLSKKVNLDTHITDIANLVEWEDLTDICLVAHSYAGYPASGALERVGNRVSSIVWVDALKPADGQSFRDAVPFPLEEGAISRPAPKALP